MGRNRTNRIVWYRTNEMEWDRNYDGTYELELNVMGENGTEWD